MRNIESKLNDRGHSMARVQYLNSERQDARQIREAALDTLQTAMTMRHGAAAPVEGQAGAKALAAFYAWV